MENQSSLYDNYLKLLKSAKYYESNFCIERTPLTMSILVTNRCTLKCRHCFNHEHQGNNPFTPDPDELSLEQFKLISASMGRFMKAYFSGGEPFIRDDLCEIVQLFVNNNGVTNISISTNGQNAASIYGQTEAIMKRLPEYVKLSLGFSLDGFCEYHEAIRGKGTYEKALQSLAACRELRKEYKNLHLYTCSTINVLNQYVMPEFLKMCITELGVDSIALLKTRQVPRAGNNFKHVELENLKKSISVIEEYTFNGMLGSLNLPQTFINFRTCKYVYNTLLKKERAFECYAGVYGGYINYNGDVGVCEVLEPLANLAKYEFDFSKLWATYANKREAKKCDPRCQCCTHETEGIIPSLFFGSNRLEFVEK